MKTKVSQIKTLHGQYEYNRKQILWLTGMSEDDLFNLQLSVGLDWLRFYTNEDYEFLCTLMQQPLIWKWWLNEWNRLDDQYVLRKLYAAKPAERTAAYRNIHNAIFVENIPTYVLLEESYAIAIGQLNDKIQKS